MKKVSVFYGGGVPSKAGRETNTASAPLAGGPLDDKIAQLYAAASEDGFSNEEIQKRLKADPEIAEVTLTDSDLIINGIPLNGRLIPSVRAFYILVARHPEGIEKESDPKELVKDSFCKYLDEYKNIHDELTGIRKKKVLDMSRFNIDSRFPRYRDIVNDTITEVEEENGGLNLSSCKVVGTRRLSISAKVIDRVGLHTVPEL